MRVRTKSSSDPYLLKEKIAAGSQDPEDYSALVGLELERGSHDQAISLYERALTLIVSKADRARIYWELGWLLQSLGKPDEALKQAEAVQELLSTEAETPEVLFLKATAESLWAQCLPGAEMSNNAFRSALRKLNHLIANAPDFENIAFAYVQAAHLNNLLGNSPEAARLCELCLQKSLEPRDRVDCLLQFAEALRLEERLAPAEDAVLEALKCAEKDKGSLPHIYSMLGLIQYSSNRASEARESFMKALNEIEGQPFLPDKSSLLRGIYWHLGRLYCELGEQKNAIRIFQKLLDLYPTDDLDRRNTLLWLGQSYYASGALDEAISCYKEVADSPNASKQEIPSICQGLGKIHYELGEYDEAIAAFQKVFAYVDSGDAVCCTSFLWLGYCYEAKGDFENARHYYEEVQRCRDASEEEKASAKEFLERLPQVSQKTFH